MLYSKTTGGFYESALTAQIPEDAVEITQEDYQTLLSGQFQGKVIVSGPDGKFILVEMQLTQEQQYKKYESAIQSHMNFAAKSAGYDDIKTVVTYAEEPAVTKFQSDGKAFRKWRSLVWAYTYEQLDLVLSEQRPKPTVEEFLLELPTLEHLV